MAENPPPGYNRRDQPLKHNFFYKYELTGNATNRSSTYETYCRTTNDQLNPSDIEVNKRNAAYAVDGGSTTMLDSIIQFMTIHTTLTLTEAAIKTDLITALKVYWQNVHGAFADAWTPADEGVSTATTAQVLDLTSDATNEDVTPTFNNIKCVTEQAHPLSTVTHVEVFGDLNLDTNTNMECVGPMDIDEYYDMLSHGTIGGKLKSLTGPIRSRILTAQRPTFTIKETKMVPRNVRFGNPHMYFGRRYFVPIKTDQHQILSDNQTDTDVGWVLINTIVRYNEWNPDFDQARM